MSALGAQDQRVHPGHHVGLLHQVVHHVQALGQLTLCAQEHQGLEQHPRETSIQEQKMDPVDELFMATRGGEESCLHVS